MKNDKSDLMQGTLDLLILKTLQRGAMHGWAISQHIQKYSKEVLTVKQGSLYPCLQRLEGKGYMKAYWDISENKRRAKFYELTRQGRKQLESVEAGWLQFAKAVQLVLEA